ncbi:TraB family protein [Euphorbia peplus]|nr:TraB family protein [Euphorbia peplus]
MIQEMSKEFPTLVETVVHERDRYMSSTLLKVAREHSSVVVVVGKGHLPGIKKHWKQPIEALQLEEILELPERVSAFKHYTSLGLLWAWVIILYM